ARSDNGKDWRKVGRENPPTENSGLGFGERLKTYFESPGPLASKLDAICKRLDIASNDDKASNTPIAQEESQAERAKQQTARWKRQEIHLRLMRQFIRQMVIQYEYKSGAFKREDQ